MTKGPQPGQTFDLSQNLTNLGRGPSNDIVINHAQVSRQHARFIRQGGTMVLEDLGSTNGTYVNGVRLTTPQTLNNGDTVGLGDTVTFTFYGPAVGAEDTVVARPSAHVSRPDTVVAPPSSGPPRAEPPAYAAAPPPSYAPPSPAIEEQEEKPSRTWLWVGCGCLLLVVILACVGAFILDYLQMLPPVFYEPLRWLGIF
jgi:predicted component of type VI protein secretion system